MRSRCAICGKERTTGDNPDSYYCRTCEQFQMLPRQSIIFGWQCPVCGRVWRPQEDHCKVCNVGKDSNINGGTIL